MRPVISFCAIPLFLTACMGGGGGERGALDLLSTEIGMGTEAGMVSASGLPFAQAGQDVRNLETIPVTVRMGRMQRDRNTGDVSFFVSDEVVTLSSGFYQGFYRPSSFTLDGVTYELDSGAVMEGRTTTRHTDRELPGDYLDGARHEIAIVTEGSPDNFHEYGVFIMGFETDPAALPTGSMTYAGQFNIDTWPSQNGGTPSNFYRPFNGNLTLDVDFGAAALSGTFSGTAQIGDNEIIFTDNVAGTIPETVLTGNGFEGQMVFTECQGTTSCTSNMTIGGAVYGPSGERISGLIMSDATFVRESDGVELRLLGPGTFTTTPVSPE